MQIILSFFQLILVIILAPLLSGIITKVKNNLRFRNGQSVFQPYYNLFKFFSKEEVISENASWIFKIAPIMVFASAITALFVIPVFTSCPYQKYVGDFFAIIFIFALGRFFLALAGLDTASSFCGMGSSREMFISSLAEPVLCLVIFAVSLNRSTTSFEALYNSAGFSIPSFIALIALFMVVLAETGRVPVDNQETHLELTMIHEAMILEYSGKSLALIEVSAYIRQMILFSLIVNIICPAQISSGVHFTGLVMVMILTLVKMGFVALIVAVVEVSLAKMRLFRAVDFLSFAFVLAFIAVVSAVLSL